MDYCNKCGGTGRAVNGKFCTCKEGRLKKALEAASQNAKVKKMVEEETKKIAKEAKETTPATAKSKKDKPTKKAIDYAPGDWVTIHNYNQDLNGVLCEVITVDTGDDDVKVLARGKNKKGLEMKGTTWLHTSYLIPAPVELNTNDKAALREMYINMAIDTNDEDWLKQLGGKKK
jgi:hypothetical protein